MPGHNSGILEPQSVAFPDIAGDSEARELRARAARRDVSERRRIAERLRQALTHEGFLLHYQPYMHLKTGRLEGAEAVIRLKHRRRGLILPHHFMPVAEHFEVINDIGAWMLHRACADAAHWPAQANVSVRLAHRQLRSGHLIKHLIEALTRTGLASERLELCLSEAMLIDDDPDTIFTIKALASLGARLALNDFGTGHASLAALKRLPLSTLKLDRQMVQRLGQDYGDNAIVHAAIEAGHAMGCSVLADGVESEAQSRLLQEIGCDEAQGPYFAQPVPAEDFLKRL
ncbi:MAG: EAL domain-containing protein [Acidocella sp.]|nr:EAL domain-containing protein [Acidocella sp.]